MNMAFFAVAMTVLIGFAGLATDSGLVWVTRTELQHSVDAAALAGAQELDDTGAAKEVACDYATNLNEVPDMFGDTGKPRCTNGMANVEFSDEDTRITVTAYRTVEPIFGQVLGFDDVDVHAQGIAVMTSTGSGMECLFPWFIPDTDFEALEFWVELFNYYGPFTFPDRDRYLDPGGPSGWSEVAEVMMHCGESAQTGDVGDPVDIKSGTVNSAYKAWEDWAEYVDIDNPEAADCDRQDPSRIFNWNGTLKSGITLETCPRLIVVPVVRRTGHNAGEIERFATVYYSGISNKNVRGYLVDIDPEDLGYTGTGTGKKVTLVSR